MTRRLRRLRKPSAEHILAWMCTEMQRAFRHIWTRADCINAAKLAVRLLTSYGLHAYQFPTTVVAANPHVSDYMRKRGIACPFDLLPAEVSAAGGRLAVMGRLHPDQPTAIDGGWRGHLVVIISDRYLLDLTVDAMNNSADGIVGIKPCWRDMGNDGIREFKSGAPLIITIPVPHQLTGIRIGDVTVAYRADPDNRGYATMDSWTAWTPVSAKWLRDCQQRFNHVRGDQ